MAKRKKGERRTGECAYCGAVGPISRDHVPPENLFPPPLPHLVTVPACDRCNSGFKLDDEYFRLVITLGLDGERLPRELEHSVNAIKKLDDPKKPGLKSSMLQARRRIDVVTPAGIYLGQADGMKVNDERVLRTVERIVRGLYFEHRGRRMPPDHELSVSYIGDRHRPGDLGPGPEAAAALGALVEAPSHVLGNEVLRYAFVSPPEDERMEAWLLEFFANHLFFALVLPPE